MFAHLQQTHGESANVQTSPTYARDDVKSEVFITGSRLKEAIFEAIQERGVENLTKKMVLRIAESKLGLERKVLKGNSEAYGYIDAYLMRVAELRASTVAHGNASA